MSGSIHLDAEEVSDIGVKNVITAYKVGRDEANAEETMRVMALSETVNRLRDELGRVQSHRASQLGRVRKIVASMRAELDKHLTAGARVSESEKPFLAFFLTLEKEVAK